MPPLILAAAFLEGLSLTLIQGYLPLYVRGVLHEPSYVTVAFIVAVPAFGTVLASNFWGGLSDVSGRLKPMILIGLAGYAIALAGIPIFGAGLQIMAFVGAASFLFGTLAPSLKTYVTLLRPDRKAQSIAYVLMSQSIGWLSGSLGAGWLLEGGIASGLRVALWITAGLLAAHAIACAALLRDERRPPLETRNHGPWLSRLALDLITLYENPRMLRLCVLAFLFVSGNYAAWGFFALFMHEKLGASIHTIRYSLGVSSILGIASFLYVGALVRRFGERLILAVGVSLYVGMYLGIATAKSPIVVAAFFALPLYSLVNVSANALASRYAISAQRGGGLGVLNGTYALATIVGPVTAGFLADRYGLGAIPWLSASFLAIAVPLAWVQVASGRERRADHEELSVDGG
jgi:predicted MFS family arabinose efflux permease